MVRRAAPDVRPDFVSGAGSRRPLMAETRVHKQYQVPQKSGLQSFAMSYERPSTQINPLEVFMDRLLRHLSQFIARQVLSTRRSSRGLAHVFRHESGGQPVRPFFRLHH